MRIVIAEDAALFRAGLARLLEDEGHQVCAAVADGAALLAAADEHHPRCRDRGHPHAARLHR